MVDADLKMPPGTSIVLINEVSGMHDVVVVAGACRSFGAIALAQVGVNTALIARRALCDNRTTALLGGSVGFLEQLDVWPRCRIRRLNCR